MLDSNVAFPWSDLPMNSSADPLRLCQRDFVAACSLASDQLPRTILGLNEVCGVCTSQSACSLLRHLGRYTSLPLLACLGCLCHSKRPSSAKASLCCC